MARDTKQPGWYQCMPVANHIRLGQLEQAWEAVKRVNMPEYPWTLLNVAVLGVELGRHDEARGAIASLRTHGRSCWTSRSRVPMDQYGLGRCIR